MQRSATWALGALTAVLAVGCQPATGSAPSDLDAGPAIIAAKAAAKAWLQTVDRGAYAKSWASSASLFRKAVSKQKWVQQLNGVRAPLGDATARAVRSARYTTQLPGAPDGEYVIIQYESRFANKRSAIETVTPMKDGDGQWRVSGYYIR